MLGNPYSESKVGGAITPPPPKKRSYVHTYMALVLYIYVIFKNCSCAIPGTWIRRAFRMFCCFCFCCDGRYAVAAAASVAIIAAADVAACSWCGCFCCCFSLLLVLLLLCLFCCRCSCCSVFFSVYSYCVAKYLHGKKRFWYLVPVWYVQCNLSNQFSANNFRNTTNCKKS